MSFMDAMKKVERTEVQAGAPKVNPLLAKLNAAKASGDASKKPNPLLKTKLVAPTPKVEAETEVEVEVGTPAQEEKTIQQKAVEEAKEIIREEIVEEVKEAIKESEATPVVEEETQAEAPKVAEVVAEEEEIVEEVAEVPTAEQEVEQAEEATTVEEEKPKRGKRNTRKKTAKEPKVATKADQSTEADTVEIFTTRISYEDAVMAIRHPFANEEFETLKEEITEELNSIIISEDMNSITAKAVNAQLAALYQKVWFEHQASKTFYENLIQKDNGLIDRVKYASIGEGSNDAQRRKAGIEACIRYTAPGATEPVNLFELLDYAREQFYFFDNVMRHLSYKKDIMISMNAALKIEDKVLGSGTQM